MSTARLTVLLLGATGTIGQATHAALLDAGHRVVAPVRKATSGLPGALRCTFDLGGLQNAMKGCDAVISCVASRTGAPQDAWAVDHGLNSIALRAARQAGLVKFVLLSAICVQQPKLAFQQAKLAFEAELAASGLTWSIVRPTAFFKSLSGQVERLRTGKPFLLFGDGALTACKPISDRDLGKYLVSCLTEPERQNRILPIGGPGPALTPKEQGTLLFDALGQEPRFRSVPVSMLTGIILVLSIFGRIAPGLRGKADLARIGRYYATESMLVWDEATKRYDAAATPEFGSDTLAAHYRALAENQAEDQRGAHAVF